MKLHLGCGIDVREGYINIDKYDHRCKGVLSGDMLDLSEFDDNSIDEILLIEVIEHLDFLELATALKEWNRVLKPGGFLHTECPDLLEVSKEIIKHGLSDSLMFDIYGQYYRPWDKEWSGREVFGEMIHKQGFDFARIKWLAEKHGFPRVSKLNDEYKKHKTPLSLCVRWYK